MCFNRAAIFTRLTWSLQMILSLKHGHTGSILLAPPPGDPLWLMQEVFLTEFTYQSFEAFF